MSWVKKMYWLMWNNLGKNIRGDHIFIMKPNVQWYKTFRVLLYNSKYHMIFLKNFDSLTYSSNKKWGRDFTVQWINAHYEFLFTQIETSEIIQVRIERSLTPPPLFYVNFLINSPLREFVKNIIYLTPVGKIWVLWRRNYFHIFVFADFFNKLSLPLIFLSRYFTLFSLEIDLNNSHFRKKIKL